MLISIEVIRKCNEKGEVEIEHSETGQGFVLLTKKKYKELQNETEGEDG
jgi:hypothetical protein